MAVLLTLVKFILLKSMHLRNDSNEFLIPQKNILSHRGRRSGGSDSDSAERTGNLILDEKNRCVDKPWDDFESCEDEREACQTNS